jgi:heme/copper-type cytochrome/quinol oxidase subunit 3
MGTAGVRNGPATVGSTTETRWMPFSRANTNAASSAFFALTGFHGVHVTIGIVMLLSLVALSLRGRIPQARAEAVEIIGLYWHFVDVVWIVIFTVVYLIK